MNKKKIIRLIGITVVALVGVFAATKLSRSSISDEIAGKTVSIVHDAGETEVPVNPQKVVTLSYSTLDILDEMDLEDKIVGTAKSNLPTYLDEYDIDSVTDVGNLKEFSLEAINELQPDLIIIEGRQADSYADLSAIAPTIQLGTDNTKYISSLERNINALGQIFDKEDLATEKLNKINERIDIISEKVKKEGYNALALMVTDGSMSVYGNGSRFSIIFDKFGFEADDSEIEVSNHGQSISYEYLLSKNPDYLFVVDKNNATGATETPEAAKDILNNELVNSIDTYKNGNIIYLNGPAWYVGGAGIQAADLMIADMENLFK